MISRSFERPERTASRTSDARNRYKIQYTRTQHRPASRQVNDHGRVSGTHTVPGRLVNHSHRHRLRLPLNWPWAHTFTTAPQHIPNLPQLI